MTGFQHDIAGGGGKLIIAALQSPDFSHLVSGWQVRKDGSAEFNNVTIRGVFNGTDYVINASGAFFYSSTPAAGNLIASVASTPGTDQFGNPYFGGIFTYGTASGSVTGLLASGADASIVMIPGGSTHAAAVPPQMFAGAQNPGAANEVEELNITSGKASGNADAAIQLFSAAADNTSAARAVVEFGGIVAMTVSKANTTLTTGGGLSGTPAITQTDLAVDTNANNGTQPMTKTWSIPANDPQAGTVYEIETTFSGTFQTATLGFKPRLSANPAMTTSGGDVVANNFFTAGQGFAGLVKLKMIITSTGVSGTADFFIDGGIGFNGARASGASGNSAYLSSQATGVAIDTTAANTLVIVSVWGSSVASQTVIARGSTLTRKGP